jgi:hypothetical protein
MNGADAGGHQQYSALVFLQQTRLTRCLCVGDRIVYEAGYVVEFFGERQHLAQQRIMGVAGTHPSHEAARGEQFEAGAGRSDLPCRLGDVLRQAQNAAQFARIANRIPHRLLPRGVSRQGRGGADSGLWGG